MKINYNTTITGEKCMLVPYRREHVEVYHTWMQDPALQEATASEPLSLDQEYEMQQSWARDADKATFIVLDTSALRHSGHTAATQHAGDTAAAQHMADTAGSRSRGGMMAGDVNLFFNDHDDHSTAEIEVMIAEPASRRKGIATEALQLFMAYAVSALGVTKFRAKIGEANHSSLQLFDKLGYKEVSKSAVFKEVTLELPVEGQVRQQLTEAADKLQLGLYDA